MTDTRIYFVQCGPDGPIKIGYATNIITRLSGMQTGNPEELHLLAHMPGGPDEEWALHRKLSDSRMRGEWFRNSPEVWAEVQIAKGFSQEIPQPAHPWQTEDVIARREDQDRFMRMTFVAALRRIFENCQSWKQGVADIACVSSRTVEAWLNKGMFPHPLTLMRLIHSNEDMLVWHHFTLDVLDIAQREKISCAEALRRIPMTAPVAAT